MGPMVNRYLHLLLLMLLLHGTGAVAQADGAMDVRACLDSCLAQDLRGDQEAAYSSASEALELARRRGDRSGEGHALLQLGRLRQRAADHDAALDDYQGALTVFEALGDLDGQAEALNNIGAVHHYDRNYDQAGAYYARSLALRERLGDRAKLALPYNNMGSLLEDVGDPDSALYYHRMCMALRQQEGDSAWLVVGYSHIGACHDLAGRTDSALFYLRRAEVLGSVHGSRSVQATMRCMLGTALLHAGRTSEALHHCTEAYRSARSLGEPYIEQESCKCLHQANARLGRNAEAYAMLDRYTTLRDSMFGVERATARARIEMTHLYERRRMADSLDRLDAQRRSELAYQERLAGERDQKRLFLFAGVGVLLVAAGLLNRLRYLRRSRNLIERERQRSEVLLRNILPGPIAEELKEHGRAVAREVEGVSILFTDFHDFTRLGEQMDAQSLVGEIDACFRAFDAICARHGLEKIKTIGDAYMCAGGLPTPWDGSALHTVRAALEMQAWVDERAGARSAKGEPAFRMRAGVHTGPVVAGIVGEAKFQYDLWGDAVNTAARMESSGAVGRVNISASTHALVKDTPGLRFEARGGVQTKGKGMLTMYFVENADATP